MRSTLSLTMALMLLLTGNVLAIGSCYTGGKTWSDVGTEDEVNNALGDLCKKLVGDCPLYTEHVGCQNLNGFAIHGHILPVEGPQGHTGVTINQDACMDLLKQVKDKCPHGGSLGLLETHPDNYGGDKFKSNTILDPDKGSC